MKFQWWNEFKSYSRNEFLSSTAFNGLRHLPLLIKRNFEKKIAGYDLKHYYCSMSKANSATVRDKQVVAANNSEIPEPHQKLSALENE